MPTLVVGVDFSPPSKKALDAAVALAKGLGATLVIVHANEPLPVGAKRGHLDAVTLVRREIEADDNERMAKTWVAAAGKQVKVDFVTREGRPADVVLAEAKKRKAAYVVVGSHGRTGLKRAVLGSVAHDVLAASPMPVVVVPAA